MSDTSKITDPVAWKRIRCIECDRSIGYGLDANAPVVCAICLKRQLKDRGLTEAWKTANPGTMEPQARGARADV